MVFFYSTLEDILALEAKCKKICAKELNANLNPQRYNGGYYFRTYKDGKYSHIKHSSSECIKYIEFYCAKKVLVILRHQILSYDKVPKIISELDTLFSRLYSMFKERTPKWALPSDIVVENWQNEKYEECDYFPEQKTHQTDRGEIVRSKIEVWAANSLNRMGVPYKYEAPVQTKFGVRYADFTLLNRRTWIEVYVEIMGIMGDPTYASNANKKMHEYSRSGIILGKNLLIIFETSLVPFDIVEFENMIKAHFPVKE